MLRRLGPYAPSASKRQHRIAMHKACLFPGTHLIKGKKFCDPTFCFFLVPGKLSAFSTSWTCPWNTLESSPWKGNGIDAKQLEMHLAHVITVLVFVLVSNICGLLLFSATHCPLAAYVTRKSKKKGGKHPLWLTIVICSNIYIYVMWMRNTQPKKINVLRNKAKHLKNKMNGIDVYNFFRCHQRTVQSQTSRSRRCFAAMCDTNHHQFP